MTSNNSSPLAQVLRRFRDNLIIIPEYVKCISRLFWIEFSLCPWFYIARYFPGNFRKQFLHAFFTMLGSFSVFKRGSNDEHLGVLYNLMSPETFWLSPGEKTQAWKSMRVSRAKRQSTQECVEGLFRVVGKEKPELTAICLLLMRCPMNAVDREELKRLLFLSEEEARRIEQIALEYARILKRYKEIEIQFASEKKLEQQRESVRRENRTEYIDPSTATVNDPILESFATLGLVGNETEQEVKRRYRAAVKVYHPDRLKLKVKTEKEMQEGVEQFRILQEAYEQICKSKNW